MSERGTSSAVARELLAVVSELVSDDASAVTGFFLGVMTSREASTTILAEASGNRPDLLDEIRPYAERIARAANATTDTEQQQRAGEGEG